MMNDSIISKHQDLSISCPYLDTITRSALDFDFEPCCSISLDSGPHIYACLICGQYFKGKGNYTPAYLHSIDMNHHVFIHLTKGTFYCLPDDYAIHDVGLEDISSALRPIYTLEEINSLDDSRTLSRDLFGRSFIPGFVGLNNLCKTDYINAVTQALAHVKPLRDFFLRCGNNKPFKYSLSWVKIRKNGCCIPQNRLVLIDPKSFSPVAVTFGALIRKIWSGKRFKSTVDPHMFIQAVMAASKKKFRIGFQAEAGYFLTWLLHMLHIGVGGTIKNPSIISKVFHGKLEITSIYQRKKRKRVETSLDDRIGSDDEYSRNVAENLNKTESKENIDFITNNNNIHFSQLTLDIPEKPLFKDEEGGLVIPQEPLVSVLKKFDGISFQDVPFDNVIATTIKKYDGIDYHYIDGPKRRRHRIRALPNYLIINLARFKKNRFTYEKNPTIVSFPVTNLDLSQYLYKSNYSLPTHNDIRDMNLNELKYLLRTYNRFSFISTMDEDQLRYECLTAVSKKLPIQMKHKYNLVANITHTIPSEVGREGKTNPLEEGSYLCHVQHKASGKWYELQDLHVQEIMPQLIGVSESYILIFERL